MQDPAPGIISVLLKYMNAPAARVETSTQLSDLDIDRLDLPMIVLDIEDAFDVHIRHDTEIEDCVTVRDLVVCVAACLDAKAQELHRRASIPRTKRTWLSTEAEQRH